MLTNDYYEYLERVRNYEMSIAISHIPKGSKVLEIGGSDGFQARMLADAGFEVVSIDIADRNRSGKIYFEVIDYDGRRIPFDAGTFDVVFSSNVLEHIAHLDEISAEIRRVLKPGGSAVHILPSAVWRLCTTFTHHLHHAWRILLRIGHRLGLDTGENRGIRYLLKLARANPPHGEYPSAFSELYFFSSYRWKRYFLSRGFGLRGIRGGGLLYSGYAMFPNMPLALRRALAWVLGSSTTIFELSANETAAGAPQSD